MPTVQMSLQQALKNAREHLNSGNLPEARHIYLAILKKDPKNRQAWQGLQQIETRKPGQGQRAPKDQVKALAGLLQQGDHATVVRQAGALAEKYPQDFNLHNLLGSATSALGDTEAAVRHFRRAVELYPGSAALHNNLGVALKDQGELQQAYHAFDRALKLDPESARVHYSLGLTLEADFHLEQAIVSYRRALEIDPAFSEARYALGLLLTHVDRHREALAEGRRLLGEQPGSARALRICGLALSGMGQHEEAIQHHRKALEIDPENAGAWHDLGMARDHCGDKDRARECYRRAIELNPNLGKSYRALADMGGLDAGDPLIDEMQERLRKGGLSEDDRMHLCFALGRVLVRLDQPEQGFPHLMEGNGIRKRMLNYSLEKDEEIFARIKSVFSDISPAVEAPASANESPTPVFILGMPRSGTSLTEQILACHSRVHGAGELQLLADTVKQTGYPEPESASQTFEAVRKAYREGLAGLSDKPFITDKMPHNFRWIGYIVHALPEARIIHMRRSPMAVCWSNFQQYFPADGMRFTFDMEDLARYYRLYDHLMAFWKARYPGRIFDLVYEELTEDPETQVRRLLEHLGLEWEDAVLDFHRSSRVVRTASKDQVRQPIYQGSSEAWRRYEPWLRPMLEILEA